MKKIFFLMFSIFFFTINLSFGKVIDSKIDNVIVYKDSALIKRIAITNITQGQNQIILKGLPNSIIDNSIQLELDPSIGKILDVKIERTYLFENRTKIKKLKDELEKINHKIKILEYKSKAMSHYTEFLKSLSPFASDTKTNSREIQKFIELIEKSLLNSQKSIANIEIEINNLQNKKEKLENEISILGNAQKSIKNIVLVINGFKTAQCKIGISYLVNRVRWYPNYDLYVDTINNQVLIDYYASIIQNSGEDWNNVKLKISTATPVFGRPGELSPWYVDIYKPRPMNTKRMLKSGAEKMFLRTPPMPQKTIYEAPKIKEEAISFSFLAKNKLNIPSDNHPHRVYLASKTINSNELLSYKAIPKLSPYVYLTSTFINPFEFPIFPGKLRIYLDGKFTGTERFQKTYAGGEKMHVFLGIDNSLSVERQLVKKFTEYTGIVSKSQKISYEYKITITNGKKRDVDIVVEDNYPVSLNEKIKIHLIEPKKDEAEIKDGIIRWKIKLKPKSKTSVTLKFNIEYPRGIEISGI